MHATNSITLAAMCEAIKTGVIAQLSALRNGKVALPEEPSCCFGLALAG